MSRPQRVLLCLTVLLSVAYASNSNTIVVGNNDNIEVEDISSNGGEHCNSICFCLHSPGRTFCCPRIVDPSICNVQTNHETEQAGIPCHSAVYRTLFGQAQVYQTLCPNYVLEPSTGLDCPQESYCFGNGFCISGNNVPVTTPPNNARKIVTRNCTTSQECPEDFNTCCGTYCTMSDTCDLQIRVPGTACNYDRDCTEPNYCCLKTNKCITLDECANTNTVFIGYNEHYAFQ